MEEFSLASVIDNLLLRLISAFEILVNFGNLYLEKESVFFYAGKHAIYYHLYSHGQRVVALKVFRCSQKTPDWIKSHTLHITMSIS